MAAISPELCGKWMPRLKTYCGRRAGHTTHCRPPEFMERQAARMRAQDRPYDPVAARRWRSAHRLTRYGLTKETFDQMLADQDYACAMCLEPFEADQRIHIDHDHTLGCHPGEKQACDRCRRGLLCHRCNIAVGWVEAYGDLAATYLATMSAGIVSDRAGLASMMDLPIPAAPSTKTTPPAPTAAEATRRSSTAHSLSRPRSGATPRLSQPTP